MLLSAVAVAFALLGASSAWAHDEVVATSPAQGATVPTAPAQVELELSGPAQPLGTQVLVSGPDGAPVSWGDVQFRDTTVVQPLVEELPAGTYTVEWRVTSSDGHPIAGAFTFAVSESATTSESVNGPTAQSEPGADAAAAEQERADVEEAAADQPTDSSLPVAWIVIVAVLLGAIGGLLAWRLRARA